MSNHSRAVRNKRQHQTKSSGERTVIRYGPEKTSASCCSNCGQALAGIPRLDPAKIGKLTGTQRRVGRIYMRDARAHLCHSRL